MVFRGEVGAEHMNLGLDGINSSRKIGPVTLLLFSNCMTSCSVGKIDQAENHLGIGTPLRATQVRGQGTICLSDSSRWSEQGKSPLYPLLQVVYI